MEYDFIAVPDFYCDIHELRFMHRFLSGTTGSGAEEVDRLREKALQCFKEYAGRVPDPEHKLLFDLCQEYAQLHRQYKPVDEKESEKLEILDELVDDLNITDHTRKGLAELGIVYRGELVMWERQELYPKEFPFRSYHLNNIERELDRIPWSGRWNLRLDMKVVKYLRPILRDIPVLLDIPITRLRFAPATNKLIRDLFAELEIEELGQLVQRTPRELRQLYSFGKESLIQVQRALRKFRVNLAMKLDHIDSKNC